MSGEKIGEGTGIRGVRRVLCTEPNFKVEASFEDRSTLLGVEGMNIGTYVATTKPDGTLDGTGEGVFATLEGEFVTWKALGVGHFAGAGSVHYSGAISYTTKSAKLVKLNALAARFEFDVDAAGKTHSTIYEVGAKAASA